MQTHFLWDPLVILWFSITIIFILIIGKSILIPIVIALLLAFFLRPAARKLESWRWPRALAHVLLIISLIIGVLALVGVLSFAFRSFILDIPQYATTITSNIDAIQAWITRIGGVSGADQTIWIKENLNLLEIGASNAGKIFGATANTVAMGSLVCIYTFFFLYYRTKFKNFLAQSIGKKRKDAVERMTTKISRVMPSYLTGVSLVVLIMSVLNSLGFWIIGVHSPIFFGILAAVLNVIPYIGTAIGFGLVVVFTLLTQSIPAALLVIAMFLVIQFIDNNILTPNIAAGQINVNPLAAIVGIILGGVIWGITGMIIAIPILGIIKIVCDNIEGLESFGYLIGTEGNERKELDIPFSNHKAS